MWLIPPRQVGVAHRTTGTRTTPFGSSQVPNNVGHCHDERLHPSILFAHTGSALNFRRDRTPYRKQTELFAAAGTSLPPSQRSVLRANTTCDPSAKERNHPTPPRLRFVGRHPRVPAQRSILLGVAVDSLGCHSRPASQAHSTRTSLRTQWSRTTSRDYYNPVPLCIAS